MAKIKDAAAIAEKWSTVTPQRSTEYQKGVQNPRTPWAAAAAAAGPAQAAGVQAAIANKSFEKGIARAGDAGWQRGATTKGPRASTKAWRSPAPTTRPASDRTPT